MMPADSDPGDPFRVKNNIVADVDGDVHQFGVVNGDVTIYSHPKGLKPRDPLIATARQVFEEGWGVRIGRHFFEQLANVSFFVEALTAQAVILHDLRPVVVSREQPGTVVPFSARRLMPRQLTVNLDERRFSLQLGSRQGAGVEGFPYAVTASDPEYFVITPETDEAVFWYLELEWSSAGRSGVCKVHPEDSRDELAQDFARRGPTPPDSRNYFFSHPRRR